MSYQTFNMTAELSEKDIDAIIDIIGRRCRIKTCNRLRSILTYGRSTVPYYGILDRLVKDGEHWHYIAGQSYPDEIRTVRECILGK